MTVQCAFKYQSTIWQQSQKNNSDISTWNNAKVHPHINFLEKMKRIQTLNERFLTIKRAALWTASVFVCFLAEATAWLYSEAVTVWPDGNNTTTETTFAY